MAFSTARRVSARHTDDETIGVSIARVLVVVVLVAITARVGAEMTGGAQHVHDAESAPPGHVHGGVAVAGDHAMPGMLGAYAMTRDASGTSWQPDSTPMTGAHLMHGPWMLMAHGAAFLVYDDQGGRRGDTKTFSANMLMGMAERRLGAGTLGLRAMLSLEPATIGRDGYPLLLQTGETANGRTPLIDRQHPHDLFMELAASYSVPLGEGSGFVYFGLPGEPALGPPTFMHRASGLDDPEAPITHHWLDSTHVTHGVATAGWTWRSVKLEGSIFTGREPDEHRWDIEEPTFDSYATRISWNPGRDWALQASWGSLASPEQLEPAVDTERITASIIWNRPLAAGNWQTTFAWGENRNHPGRVLDGFLLESLVNAGAHHTLFGRVERVTKDELFRDDDPLHGAAFTVNKLSAGYIYDLRPWRALRTGIGALGSVHLLPSGLERAYGDTPLSFMVFTRVRL